MNRSQKIQILQRFAPLLTDVTKKSPTGFSFSAVVPEGVIEPSAGMIFEYTGGDWPFSSQSVYQHKSQKEDMRAFLLNNDWGITPWTQLSDEQIDCWIRSCERSPFLSHEDAFERICWDSNSAEIIRRATEVALSRGCCVNEDVMPPGGSLASRIQALKRKESVAEILAQSNITGVISERDGMLWVFLKPDSDVLDGADVFGVRWSGSFEAQQDDTPLDIDIDGWHVIQRSPLLIRSMYGGIMGFTKTDDGLMSVPIYDGDDGWSF